MMMMMTCACTDVHVYFYSRGILSMGPRGVMGQMPPGPGHLGNQSGLNNLPKTSRAISMPSSLSR